jgi:hypothetical protein
VSVYPTSARYVACSDRCIKIMAKIYIQRKTASLNCVCWHNLAPGAEDACMGTWPMVLAGQIEQGVVAVV